MKSLLSVIIGFGFAVAGQAATAVQSEFFYQADPSANIITPEISHIDESFKQKGGTKLEATDQFLNLAYERGLNEMFSVGGVMGYTSGDAKQGSGKSETSGLTDLTLFLKGHSTPMPEGSLHYGANLTYSPSDREFDSSSGTMEQNGVSGGTLLQPYVGYQWLWSANVVGVKLQTDLPLSDRKITFKNSTLTQERSGAEITDLSVFYEIPHDKGAVGIVYSYLTSTEEKIKNSTGSTANGNNDYTAMKLAVYSPYKVSETASVIGNLGYTTYTDYGSTDVDSSSIMELSVAGRFAF